MPHDTPAEIRDDVKCNIEALAPGCGDDFNTIHNIQAEVPDRTGFQQDLNMIFPIDRLRKMANRDEIGILAEFICAFLSDNLPVNPDPDYPLAHSLNLATDDLKAFYTEAVTAQLGSAGTSAQLSEWFYGQTAAGNCFMLSKTRDYKVMVNI